MEDRVVGATGDEEGLLVDGDPLLRVGHAPLDPAYRVAFPGHQPDVRLHGPAEQFPVVAEDGRVERAGGVVVGQAAQDRLAGHRHQAGLDRARSDPPGGPRRRTDGVGGSRGGGLRRETGAAQGVQGLAPVAMEAGPAEIAEQRLGAAVG